MEFITVEVWLYGPLARYGGSDDDSFARVELHLPPPVSVRDVLEALKLPTTERGITFINGALSAMPGVQPDLDVVLQSGDRVAFFHLKSMWPFQYRHGVAQLPALAQALAERADGVLHSTYELEAPPGSAKER